ncbi:fusaridione A cluster transcription factor [Trichophyton mentagrophytes]|nr:fusaridione A cluster transcription factor [Trichophyton mentagrophytes]
MDMTGGDMDATTFDNRGSNANQTPQAFGASNSDGSPLTSSHPGTAFAEDNNDAKRRRIARACDMCRKKKIKCDGKMPKCSHCINYKSECIFTQVEKKRNPPKGAKYIEGLENRLGRMESLLRLSGLLSETDARKTDLGVLEKRLADRAASPTSQQQQQQQQPQPPKASTIPPTYNTFMSSSASPSNSTPRGDMNASPRASSAAGSPDSQKESEAEVDSLSDMMCSLVTNNCGETRYIGSSSGFSIFSPKGIQWVNEKTGDSSFQHMISSACVDDNKWIYWKPEIFSDIFARRVFKPLPPKEEALSLFRDYFENFNCIFPLFHEPTFMHLVEKQYSRDPYEGSGWWASINVALAIAHRLRVMSNLAPQEEDKKAWLYLKNAMGVLTELTMRNTDLLSVQALLGMALFLQGTPNPQPSFFLVAAGIRLSHSIGLHKRCSGFGLNPVELEQRKRVFWIAYILDKDICLRSGRPPVQDDDDMNVELPSEDPPDNIGNVPLSDNKGKINLFRLMCIFATIESRVYRQLYSTKASRQSDGELLNTIGELDHELEEWKNSIPIDFRPEHEIKTTHRPLILPIVVLHFAYYNCLTTIHRMSVHHGYWTSRLSNYAIQGLNARPLNPRVFSSAILCVSAARASINLIKYIPQGDFACVWLILYFPISSLVTLFANILQNPLDARARSDVKLMNLVVNFLSMLATDESNGSVKRMLSVCSEFERIAKVALDRAEKESQSRRKRKTSDVQQQQQQQEQQQQQQQQQREANIRPHVNDKDTQRPQTQMTENPTVSNAQHQPFTSPFPAHINNNISSASSSTFPSPQTSSQNAFDTVINEDISAAQLKNTARFNQELNDIIGGPGLNVNPGMFSVDQQLPNESMPLDVSSFQQPFVPQDLWQMPMTLEWDWADMSNGFPFANGATE